jgi:hypothetical protein
MSEPVTDPGGRENLALEGPQFAPLPGYVQTDDQRARWYVCAAIVAELSAALEPGGRPNPRFVWAGTRALYKTDIPTGEPDPDAPVPGDWHGQALEALARGEAPDDHTV